MAGIIQVEGVMARRFCGSATVEGTVAGRTFAFSQGACETTDEAVGVNVGTVVLGEVAAAPDYFGVFLGSAAAFIEGGGGEPADSDGTYHSHNLAIVLGGHTYVLADTGSVTLAGGRTRGEFRGALAGDEGEMSGTWKCG